MDNPNANFSEEYFDRNLVITRMLTNGATFWFQGAICICGEKDRDWEWLIPEAKLGLTNAQLN